MGKGPPASAKAPASAYACTITTAPANAAAEAHAALPTDENPPPHRSPARQIHRSTDPQNAETSPRTREPQNEASRATGNPHHGQPHHDNPGSRRWPQGTAERGTHRRREPQNARTHESPATHGTQPGGLIHHRGQSQAGSPRRVGAAAAAGRSCGRCRGGASDHHPSAFPPGCWGEPWSRG